MRWIFIAIVLVYLSAQLVVIQRDYEEEKTRWERRHRR